MDLKKRRAIIFSILKELSHSNKLPDYNDYAINSVEFGFLIKYMINENYLNKEYVSINILGKVEIDNFVGIVTKKGIEYITDNEAWNSIYKNIKDYNILLNL